MPDVPHEKYFILMGYDPETKEVYGFLINSPKKRPALIQKNLTIRDFQIPIKRETHAFLQYDSEINCFSYMGIDFSEIVNGLVDSPLKICGNLSAELLQKVIEATEANRSFSSYEKKILSQPASFPEFL